MHIKWYRRYAAERLCPCVENAYLNGTIDLPPSVNEGALPIMGGGNTYEGKFCMAGVQYDNMGGA